MPLFGFLYFLVTYNLVEDMYIYLFLVLYLLCSFLGFVVLRTFFEKIRTISRGLSAAVENKTTKFQYNEQDDELKSIIQSFNIYGNYLKETYESLEQKNFEVSLLKELSDLCYITFNPDELLHVTLERALKMMKSDIGSVLVLENNSHGKFFSVSAAIGLGEQVKVGDRVDFETSIAKYAVINKSPLVIENVESDDRFGRLNRPQYGSKSFVSMPIKAMRDIIGVVNISKRKDDAPFLKEDIEVLTPLLSNAAFTYENLRLQKKNEDSIRKLQATGTLFKILRSSLIDNELYHEMFKEVQNIIPFTLMALMITDENTPDEIVIHDVFSLSGTTMSRGASYKIAGSLIDRVLRQENTITVEDVDHLSNDTDKEILGDTKSFIIVPMVTGGMKIGVLIFLMESAKNVREYREYTEYLADIFSFAVEKNRLSALVMRRSNELDTIKQIGSALASSTFEMTKVLQYTMDMIKMVINVEAGSLLLLNDRNLEFKVALNRNVHQREQVTVKLGQGIAGYVAALGEAVTENNVGQSSVFDPDVDEYPGCATRTVLCVPIISQGRVIGVIEVINKVGGNFGINDKYLLQSIASSVSIAIENARLYRETVSMAEKERGIRQVFQKFVPEGIVDKIIHGAEKDKGLIEEFRTLTLLNIDIRGFSTLAMDIGPQKTVALLNRFFSTMGGIVFEQHGIIDKYLGDGFLAIFGAPVSSPADADNAIKAALFMQREMAGLNEYFYNETNVNVKIGISIHTGEVVVGNIGFEKKMDYTVIGDSVNTLFTLQKLTKIIPNGILISEKTRRAAQTLLDIREINIPDGYNLPDMKVYELQGCNR
jgi:class 3 adenylate cyclase/GAF domain-containing protein